MATKDTMEQAEERNADEEREAAAESEYAVPLDASTPMPLGKGLAMAAAKARERRYKYGVTDRHQWYEDIASAHQADEAYLDREAERKRILSTARGTTIRHVAIGAVIGAVIEAGILRLADML